MSVGLVFLAPVLDRFTSIRWLLDLMLGFVLLLTVLAISKKQWVALTGTLLALFGYFGRIPALPDGIPWLNTCAFGALILFFLLAAVVILKYVLQTHHVTANTIWGALCVYLFLGLLWAFAYSILMHVNPEAIRLPADIMPEGSDPRLTVYIYYSFVTLTTLGYGDMTPLTTTARSLSSLEAVTGQVYLTVLVARLVGMHISSATMGRAVTKQAAGDET